MTQPDTRQPITPMDGAFSALTEAGDQINAYFAGKYDASLPVEHQDPPSQGDARLAAEYAHAMAAFALAVELHNFKSAWAQLEAFKAQQTVGPPPAPPIWRPGMPLHS